MIYRDKAGRFASKRAVVFGPWDDRVWIFGAWRELTPVTPQSIRESNDRYFAALARALDAESPKVTTTR